MNLVEFLTQYSGITDVNLLGIAAVIVIVFSCVWLLKLFYIFFTGIFR